uniref:Uncharacterized protein n=1 Tax=Rhizophora mucronata TaxID=61149 RepID=A0A2P2R531_RHIMU
MRSNKHYTNSLGNTNNPQDKNQSQSRI